MDDTIHPDDRKTVRDVLLEKHPKAAPLEEEAKLDGEPQPIHAVYFDGLDADLLKRITMQCHGSAGPSGLDSAAWRRMCTCYKGASSHLCTTLASFAHLLATTVLSPDALAPFLVCRPIALDKNPGVRPIGVCEVLRRIVSKAILRIAAPDVEDACGFLQKCSGMPAGIESAVHAMQQLYDKQETEGILLVDATNAFNSLNRQAALHNVRRLCPAMATVVTKTPIRPLPNSLWPEVGTWTRKKAPPKGIPYPWHSMPWPLFPSSSKSLIPYGSCGMLTMLVPLACCESCGAGGTHWSPRERSLATMQTRPRRCFSSSQALKMLLLLPSLVPVSLYLPGCKVPRLGHWRTRVRFILRPVQDHMLVS